MQVQSYLFFNGRCEEAFSFYKEKLGAEAGDLLRYDQAPEAAAVPPGSGDKIMHMSFKVGGTTIFASDGQCGPDGTWSGTTTFKGFSQAILTRDADESRRLFDALSEGGEVQMPFGETFFSSGFGAVADKFGVSWMVVAPPK